MGGSKAVPGAQAASAKAVAEALAVPAGREGKPGKPPGWRGAAGAVAAAQRMQAASRDKALERMQARTLPASPVHLPCISRISRAYAGQGRRPATCTGTWAHYGSVALSMAVDSPW